MHFNPKKLRNLTAFIASILLVSGIVGLSHAFAALTFTGTSVTGDSGTVIDATGTISIGTSSATGVTIGKSGTTVTLPGTVDLSALGSSGSPCLAVNSSGVVSTSTCGSGGSGGTNYFNATSSGIYATSSLTVGPTVLSSSTGIATTFDCDAYANLNACLDAAKNYVGVANDGTDKAARILIPNGTWALTGAPYTLVGGMQLMGIEPRLETTNTSADLSMTPDGGTWIDCGGNQCFQGNALRGVMLEDLGFKNFTNIATFGGDGLEGLTFSTLANIIGVGSTTVNGSNAGFILYNLQHVNGSSLNFYDVNTGLHLISQFDSYQPGNSVFSDMYTYTYPKSVANGNNTIPGLWLEVKKPTSGHASGLNYITLIRPQINSYNGDGTGNLVTLQGNTDGNPGPSVVFGADIEGLDIEGAASTGVYMDYANNDSIHFAGTAITGGGTELYVTPNASYNYFTSDYNNVGVNASCSNQNNIFFGQFKADAGCIPGMYDLAGNITLNTFNSTVSNVQQIGYQPLVGPTSTDILQVAAPNGQTNVTFGTNAGTEDFLALTLGSNGYNYVSSNAFFDGSNWNLRDTSREGWIYAMISTNNGAGSWGLYHANPGSNPATLSSAWISLNSAGNFSVTNNENVSGTLQVVDGTNNSSTIKIGAASKSACLEMGAASGTIGATVYVYFDSHAVMYATTTQPAFCK